MTRKLMIAACAMLAVGAFGIGGSEAEAQCRSSYGYRGGNYGYGGGSYYGGRGVSVSFGSRSFAPAYRTVSVRSSFRAQPNFGYSNSRYRSNRGHYDWHPTSLVPHGNHYDIQPGHWDYHRGGHYGHH